MNDYLKRHPSHILIMGIILIVSGLLLLFNSFQDAHSFYFEEYDQHVTDVMQMVDHSVAEMLERCRSELHYALNRKGFQNAEDAFLETGSPDRLRDSMTQSILMNEHMVCRVLVVRDGVVQFSSDENDARTYQLIRHEGDDDLAMCQDDTGQNYLSVSASIPNGTLQYLLLIPLEYFYSCTVAEHVYDTYWIVLYDLGNDLFLQNEWTEPCFTFLTAQEALAREDGYSIIVRQEQQPVSDIVDYKYINRFGIEDESRIAVTSSAESQNGEFAIGVALASGVQFEGLQHNLAKTIFSSLLTLFGLALGLHIIITTRIEKNRVESRLKVLEEESKTYAQLLAQQKELAHHQRMETMGTLTAGIAHEFNNLLTPIMGYSMMILESQDDTSEPYDNALEIYNASVKAKKLVARISRLSGKNSDDSLKSLSFTALIHAAVEMARPAMPNKVELSLDTDDRAQIHGNASQLEQMLLNLIINAFHAMQKDGGTLTIRTAVEEEQIICKISDTGIGIPKELQEKVFEPFFSTKESGRGTGLGLAIVAQVVMEHRGTVSVDSVPGNTVFTLTFPQESAQ